jgi:hypothetical protein
MSKFPGKRLSSLSALQKASGYMPRGRAFDAHSHAARAHQVSLNVFALGVVGLLAWRLALALTQRSQRSINAIRSVVTEQSDLAV